MGDEIRAFNNLGWYRATGDAPNSLIGLNGYGPNINIARDPRFGRTSELPGEDPFLSGTYATEMVRGGQGLDAFESGDSNHLKMTLGLKHYDLYSVEVDRPSFIPNVTAQDLWETYLPQYSLGFRNKDISGQPAGGAMGTMCSCESLNFFFPLGLLFPSFSCFCLAVPSTSETDSCTAHALSHTFTNLGRRRPQRGP